MGLGVLEAAGAVVEPVCCAAVRYRIGPLLVEVEPLKGEHRGVEGAEVASAAGLTSQRYDLLLAIKTGPGEVSTVTELSSRLSLRQTTVTELVKRAEQAGLVERSASTADGRVSMLALTADGERRLVEAFLGLREERRQLAEAMSAVGSTFRAFVHSQQEVVR